MMNNEHQKRRTLIEIRVGELLEERRFAYLNEAAAHSLFVFNADLSRRDKNG